VGLFASLIPIVFLFLLVLRLRSSKRLFRSTGEIPESQRN